MIATERLEKLLGFLHGHGHSRWFLGRALMMVSRGWSSLDASKVEICHESSGVNCEDPMVLMV
jgi:hypothetical protein